MKKNISKASVTEKLDIIHLGLPKFVGPRLQPIEPIGKSGTG
jgi:hypothetical protein